MTKQNEKIFLEKLNNIDSLIKEAQHYIKDNFNVDSEYDSSNDLIHLWMNKIDENNKSLNDAQAYIIENIGNEFVNVVFGK